MEGLSLPPATIFVKVLPVDVYEIGEQGLQKLRDVKGSKTYAISRRLPPNEAVNSLPPLEQSGTLHWCLAPSTASLRTVKGQHDPARRDGLP